MTATSSNRVKTLSALVALLGAILLLAATMQPAQAAPAAWLERWIHIAASPSDSMATATKSRRIYLASGSYLWWSRLAALNGASRNITLGAGWYTWSCSLDPRNGYYSETCQLNPDRAGWATATLSSTYEFTNAETRTFDAFWPNVLAPNF